MRALVPLLLGSCVALGCLPDNPSGTADSDDTTETGDTGGSERVETGPLGCPSGESCTIVALSQTLDDRVDLFTARGFGPSYRGALDVDLKPNPGGDITGELLDEPYGLGWDGDALHVLLGHYPTRAVGSLLSVPAASLADYAIGGWVPATDWFQAGTTSGGFSLTPTSRMEPLMMVVQPSTGLLLVSVFANDLSLTASEWTQPSALITLAPAELAQEIGDPECAGAWQIVAVDDQGDAVAMACDGDESVAFMDTSAVAEGEGASLVCRAEIPFSDRTVRYLSADGLGGVVVAENPSVASTTESARLWWFRGDCSTRSITTLEGPISWQLREMVLVPDTETDTPRWLVSRVDGADRGVLVFAGDPETGELSECGRISALDDAGAWIASGGTQPLAPHTLALTADGLGLAVGAGPNDYEMAGPGYGSLWWVELDAGDPCQSAGQDGTAVTELGASAPAVDPQVPETWWRGPDVVAVIEVAG